MLTNRGYKPPTKQVRKDLEKVAEGATNLYAWNKYGITQTKMGVLGHKGLPDRIYWIPGGRPLLIEWKREGGKNTKLQDHTIQTLRDKGYDCEVCDSYELGKELIDRYAEKAGVKKVGSP